MFSRCWVGDVFSYHPPLCVEVSSSIFWAQALSLHLGTGRMKTPGLPWVGPIYTVIILPRMQWGEFLICQLRCSILTSLVLTHPPPRSCSWGRLFNTIDCECSCYFKQLNESLFTHHLHLFFTQVSGKYCYSKQHWEEINVELWVGPVSLSQMSAWSLMRNTQNNPLALLLREWRVTCVTCQQRTVSDQLLSASDEPVEAVPELNTGASFVGKLKVWRHDC